MELTKGAHRQQTTDQNGRPQNGSSQPAEVCGSVSRNGSGRKKKGEREPGCQGAGRPPAHRGRSFPGSPRVYLRRLGSLRLAGHPSTLPKAPPGGLQPRRYAVLPGRPGPRAAAALPSYAEFRDKTGDAFKATRPNCHDRLSNPERPRTSRPSKGMVSKFPPRVLFL